MRVSRLKSNGKYLEGQSFALPGTLTKNALINGYDENDIEELDITKEQWEVILAGLNPETPDQVKEKKIQKEMRRLAEESLKGRGEL